MLHTDLSQIGEIWMENLPYLVIFNEFSVFWGLFSPSLRYLDPKMAVNSQNTTQGGV